jgi:hypothetical protein
MASDEKLILVDLDRGIIGVVSEFVKHTGDPDLMFIKYYPFNSIVEKLYKMPVREANTFTIYPKNRDLPGVPRGIFYVWENTPDSNFKVVADAQKKRIDELERQLDDLRLELASAQTRAESAYAGTKKLVSESQELTKSRNSNPFRDPLAFGGMPPYNGGDES